MNPTQKYMLVGLTLLVLLSCREKTELTGHWVSKEYFEGKPFKTIDFSFEKDIDFETGKEIDSVVCYIEINKNSLSHGYSALLADDSLPNRYNFLLIESYVVGLEFKNDSLYMTEPYDKFWNGVFVKVNESFVSHQELFFGSELEIELPECDGTYFPKDPKKAINFNIGYKKDSIYINFEDIYIYAADIEKTIRQGKEYLLRRWSDQTGHESLSNNIELHLNCDKRVPESFVNKIVSIVRQADSTIKIYKASFDDKNNKLCYKLIS